MSIRVMAAAAAAAAASSVCRVMHDYRFRRHHLSARARRVRRVPTFATKDDTEDVSIGTSPSAANDTLARLDALLGISPTLESNGNDADDGDDESLKRKTVSKAASTSSSTITTPVALKFPPPLRDVARDAEEAASDSRMLELGPRWDVSWNVVVTIAVLLAVESTVIAAGAIAPLVVYDKVRLPEEIPNDLHLLELDIQSVYDAPHTFVDIMVTAEVLQFTLGVSLVLAVVLYHSPLPPGWFTFSLAPTSTTTNTTTAAESTTVNRTPRAKTGASLTPKNWCVRTGYRDSK